ncbi:MAG: GNAT family N-acetyltransferase [Betaproteobacteria bacterium]|nr:GNAT family N-acetyltransferase [Betaproteobacteria bacterium]
MEIVRITDTKGHVLDAALLAKAEPVHRQLRPQIPQPYEASMKDVFATGAEMVVAVENGEVCGVAVFRITINTMVGKKIYSEDLVADANTTVKGVGRALMDFLKQEGKSRGCVSLELESGTQREQAHKFYYREGFAIKAFGFKQPLA